MAKGRKVNVCYELTEVSVGDWEGLTFEEIRKKWPGEYEERGKHPGTVAPPGGESFIQAGMRLEKILKTILANSQGNVLVVTHVGILRGWLCQLLNISSDDVFSMNIPFGSITEVTWDGQMFQVNQFGVKPNRVPGPLEIQALFEKYKTPLEVQQHGYSVAEKAGILAGEKEVDYALLHIACVLHDFCRPDGSIHPGKAAEILKSGGYPKLAAVVAQHHDLSEDAIPEAELLYLADKLVKGTESITLEERFMVSYKKCKSDDALQAWKKRYDEAKRLMMKYGGFGL